MYKMNLHFVTMKVYGYVYLHVKICLGEVGVRFGARLIELNSMGLLILISREVRCVWCLHKRLPP